MRVDIIRSAMFSLLCRFLSGKDVGILPIVDCQLPIDLVVPLVSLLPVSLAIGNRQSAMFLGVRHFLRLYVLIELFSGQKDQVR